MSKHLVTLIALLFFAQVTYASSILNNLINNKQTSYLDFVLLKIEFRLYERARVLGPQPIAYRIQYSKIFSGVSFLKEESKILISIVGTMDKTRYSKKKYQPKNSDCNIVRNKVLYGKYGYSPFTAKRNKYLTPEDMEFKFKRNFLNNLSLSKEEVQFLVDNTFIEVEILAPRNARSISCYGRVTDNILK